MKPIRGLTDPGFVYVPACSTDIRKRFDKERKRLARLKSQSDDKVLPITQRKKA